MDTTCYDSINGASHELACPLGGQSGEHQPRNNATGEPQLGAITTEVPGLEQLGK